VEREALIKKGFIIFSAADDDEVEPNFEHPVIKAFYAKKEIPRRHHFRAKTAVMTLPGTLSNGSSTTVTRVPAASGKDPHALPNTSSLGPV
jgi:hypothetical protein